MSERTCARRAVLTGGAAGVGVLLTGCQAYGEPAGAPAPDAPAPTGTGPTGAAPAGADSSAAAGSDAPPALAKVADIPVGGGRIFKEQGVVLTQPREGEIKAFSAKCTHQGCTVGSVADGEIVCLCHNSRFGIADGGVLGGPAGSPLPEQQVAVRDGAIRLV